MLEQKPKEITAAEVTEQIREEAARNRLAARHLDFVADEPVPLEQTYFTLNDFNKYNDEAFIHNAYRGILKRMPDPDGFNTYLTMLRNGSLSKTEILGRLRYSGEGRKKKTRIKGLFLRTIAAGMFRVPVLGYLLRLVAAFGGLPRTLKNIREYEAYTNLRFVQSRNAVLQSAENVDAKLRTIVSLMATNAEMREVERELARKADAAELSTKADAKQTDARLATKADAARTEEKLAQKADSQIVQQMQAHIARNFDSLNTDLASALQQIGQHKLSILDQQRKVASLLEATRARLHESRPAGQLNNTVQEEDHALDSLYVSFENKFRGTREDIKSRLSVYLPYLEMAVPSAGVGTQTVLDLGCGRGEWLELLKSKGFTPKGVDSNGVMVIQCQELGLDAEEADIMEFLAHQEPDSSILISGFHVVEHLSFTILIRLLDEAFRVLKPGGMIILETPNAESLLVGARNFYFDPSHRNPILPDTLKFLLEERGFAVKDILRLHPIDIKLEDKLLQELLFGPQDYGIVGVKS